MAPAQHAKPARTSAVRGEASLASVTSEVGYSARNAEEWDQLISALNAFDPIETTAAHVRRALQVQRLLAERSQRGRKLPDLLLPQQPRSSTLPSFTMTATSTSSRRSPVSVASGWCLQAQSSDPAKHRERIGVRDDVRLR